MSTPAVAAWTLTPEIYRSLEQLLLEAVQASNLSGIVLSDKNGALVAKAGENIPLVLVDFCALVAASYAASTTAAQVLGEDTKGAVAQNGHTRGVYTVAVGQNFLLSLIYEVKKVQMGVVVLRADQLLKSLTVRFVELVQLPAGAIHASQQDLLLSGRFTS